VVHGDIIQTTDPVDGGGMFPETLVLIYSVTIKNIDYEDGDMFPRNVDSYLPYYTMS
jgi:hypothetical protein